jgi:hypothetical protein
MAEGVIPFRLQDRARGTQVCPDSVTGWRSCDMVQARVALGERAGEVSHGDPPPESTGGGCRAWLWMVSDWKSRGGSWNTLTKASSPSRGFRIGFPIRDARLTRVGRPSRDTRTVDMPGVPLVRQQSQVPGAVTDNRCLVAGLAGLTGARASDDQLPREPRRRRVLLPRVAIRQGRSRTW